MMRAALALALLLTLTVVAQAAVYRRGEPGEPETLDPQKSQTVVEADIVYDLFEGLLTFDAEGHLVPGVALTWTISDDGLTYDFDLREERWSNGDQLTADDFVYSFRRLLDPATAAPYASLFYVLKNGEPVNRGRAGPETLGVKALAPHRLEIALARPTPYFLGLLAHQTAAPLDHAAVEKYGRNFSKPGKLVGNGAYTLVAYAPNDRLTLAANPTSMMRRKSRSRARRYCRSKIERRPCGVSRPARSTPTPMRHPTRSPILKQRFPGELHLSASLGIYYYAFNTKKPPFDDGACVARCR